MFEVDFLLCSTSGVAGNIRVERGRCPSCYAISVKNSSCQIKGYKEFKVQKNSNPHNSRPEVDINSFPTGLITICPVLKDAITKFRQVVLQVH